MPIIHGSIEEVCPTCKTELSHQSSIGSISAEGFLLICGQCNMVYKKVTITIHQLINVGSNTIITTDVYSNPKYIESEERCFQWLKVGACIKAKTLPVLPLENPLKNPQIRSKNSRRVTKYEFDKKRKLWVVWFGTEPFKGPYAANCFEYSHYYHI